MNKKVVVGMSGGVDSSVTAYLLKEKGYDVIGCTLEMWREYPNVCEDGLEAAKICEKLGIRHEIINYKNEFECIVVDDFINEYLIGHTPNPCIICNRHAKWKALMDFADSIGAQYIATGHYANIVRLDNGRYSVANAKSAAKDQTYFLCRLSQEQLSRTLMPLGDVLSKDEVRKIAADIGLEVATKKDSQDICFVDEDNYMDYIKNKTGLELPGPGNFVSTDGKILGKHKGISYYTVGQRKGLGIALGVPAFVKEIRPNTNEVVIALADELYSSHFVCHNINYMGIEELAIGEKIRLLGRIRYHHSGEMCVVTKTGEDELTVEFDNPVRAISPGQTAVFYDDDIICLCGKIN